MLSWSNYGPTISKSLLLCFLYININVCNTEPLIISSTTFDHLLLSGSVLCRTEKAETALKEHIVLCVKENIYTAMVSHNQIYKVVKIKKTSSHEGH